MYDVEAVKLDHQRYINILFRYLGQRFGPVTFHPDDLNPYGIQLKYNNF